MGEIEETLLGYYRLDALIQRDAVAHSLHCTKCGDPLESVYWLAVLGWTPGAFLHEAYPEIYGRDRG